MREARRRLSLLLCLFCFSAGTVLAAEKTGSVREVKLSRAYFSPALGDDVEISFVVPRAGKIVVAIVDRDGFVTRTLASNKTVDVNEIVALVWDGRDDRGAVVPDEAWSLKVDQVGSASWSYFPANETQRYFEPQPEYYDRRAGSLAYKLPHASRVHIQAGMIGISDPKTRRKDGPVLKTIVNRQPRLAGSVVENWSGFDETGKIYVPELPGFAYAIAATELPESSIITTANRERSFYEYAEARTGRSLFTRAVKNHEHHQGLTSQQDIAPAMYLEKRTSNDQEIRLRARLDEARSRNFLAQPTRIVVFIDQVRVHEIKPASGQADLRIDLPRLASGTHVLTVNWVSDYGPVSVSALQFAVSTTNKPAAIQSRKEDSQ